MDHSEMINLHSVDNGDGYDFSFFPFFTPFRIGKAG